MRAQGWRLSYPGTSFEFGGVDDVADPFRRNMGRVYVRSYELSEAAVTTEDTQLPRRDGMRFGEDYRGGVTHTFTLGVRGSSPGEAERLLAQAARAWRGDGVRSTPNTYAELTTLRGGIELTQLGRPRRFQPNYDGLAGGEASAVATFETIDDTYLGPAQTVRVDLRAIPTGGFTFPAVFPLVMGAPTTRAGGLDVGGTLPTPVVLEVHGPMVNPVVQLAGGWRVKLGTVIGSGRRVTIDPRARSVVDDQGASFAGTLGRGVDLGSLVLQPGLRQSVSLSGTDSSGSAYLVARWRDLYAGRG